jgi:hypothetical protein
LQPFGLPPHDKIAIDFILALLVLEVLFNAIPTVTDKFSKDLAHTEASHNHGLLSRSQALQIFRGSINENGQNQQEYTKKNSVNTPKAALGAIKLSLTKTLTSTDLTCAWIEFINRRPQLSVSVKNNKREAVEFDKAELRRDGTGG